MVKIAELTFDPSILKEGITQSLITEFYKCRRAFLIHANKYHKLEVTSKIRFGELFHQFLQKYYNYIKTYGILPTNKTISTFCEIPNETSILSIESKKEKFYLEETIKTLAKCYVDYWGKVDLTFFDIEVEKVFNIEFEGFHLTGKIDLYYNSNSIMEHKVKSRIDENTTEYFLTQDFQTGFYSFITDSEYVVYNIIRNPLMKRKFNNINKYNEYLENCIKENPKHYFKRIFITISKEQKTLFKEELLCKLKEIVNCKNFFRIQSSCFNLPYICQHLHSCATGILGHKYAKTENLNTEL